MSGDVKHVSQSFQSYQISTSDVSQMQSLPLSLSFLSSLSLSLPLLSSLSFSLCVSLSLLLLPLLFSSFPLAFSLTCPLSLSVWISDSFSGTCQATVRGSSNQCQGAQHADIIWNVRHISQTYACQSSCQGSYHCDCQTHITDMSEQMSGLISQ